MNTHPTFTNNLEINMCKELNWQRDILTDIYQVLLSHKHLVRLMEATCADDFKQGAVIWLEERCTAIPSSLVSVVASFGG
jgi:hypothetical protein